MSSPRPHTSPADPAAEARRRRSTLILTLVAAATILVPFLFWKQTWFGEPLTDEQVAEYLADTSKPRHQQQALVQLQQRIENGDPSAERWYPQIAALKDSPVVELRVTLAWMLGADNHSDLFHQALLSLLADRDLLVRRNAALSLVRFEDAGGHDEIVTALRPSIVSATTGGVVNYRAAEGKSLEANGVLARIEQPNGEIVEARSRLPGKLLRRSVREGSTVRAGQELAVIAPGEDHVWEALRALVLIGRPEDLRLVESFEHSSEADYSDRIRRQATLAAGEIRARAARPASGDTTPAKAE